MTDGLLEGLDIAVLLPCYNEAATIGEVVAGFRAAIPGARIYVYDNNSKDQTALRAALAGATVVREPRQGKGHVVRRMFSDIDADIYLMADGDGTYAPQDGPELIRTLLTERCDMVVGTRRGVTDDAGRRGHAFGNSIFNTLYKTIFGKDFTDIFSGYRAFSRRFAKSFPAVSGGFEIETEMSVHASVLKLPVTELALDYGRRPEGSQSKLSTFKDGAKILWMFAMLMKETRPFMFFSYISVFTLATVDDVHGAGAQRILPHRPGHAHADLDAGHGADDDGADDLRRGRDPRFGCTGACRAEAVPLHVDCADTHGPDPDGRARHQDRTGREPCAHGRKPQTRFMRKLAFFAFAGATGFAVDMGVLWLLLSLTPLDPFSARVLAIATAMLCTYLINRTFTFGASTRHVAVEGARYGSVGIASALVNYAVYSGLLIAWSGLSPYVALFFGSAVATLFSYLGYSRFVFGPNR
jgi:putative flippase GtrA